MRDFLQIADAWARDDREVLDTLSAPERRALGLIAIGEQEGLEPAGAEFVLGVKASRLFRLASTSAGPGVADGSMIEWVYSDETVDRAGDIIRQSWELGNYKANPIVLWGHAFGMDSAADEPIGRTIEIGVREKQLVGTIEFAVAESERAARIHRLARGGFVKAGSVGFRPLKTTNVSDDAERQALGLGRFGVVFERSELLEFSLCAVPCNPNALQNSVKSGAIQELDADLLKSLGTERDWERAAKRRARAFVDMGRSPPSTQGAVTEQASDGLRGMAAAAPALAEAIKALSETVRELSAGREDDAASRRMLARSITDLGQRLGATRAGDLARPVADAALSPVQVAEIQRMLKTIK